MKIRNSLLLPIIAVLVFIPAFSAQAQDDTQPLDDDFIDALVMMAVNHDLMEGRNELGNLSGLQAVINEYYDTRTASGVDDETLSWLEDQRNKQLNMIQGRIDKVRTSLLAEIDDFMKLFTDARKLTILNKHFGLAGSDSPPAAYLDNMNAHLTSNINDQIIVNLDVHTISIMPSLAPAINDSSGWGYNLPAISDSAAMIPSGGNTVPSGGNTQPPANSNPQNEPSLKPIRFTNNGFDPVTVVVESYQPAQGLSNTIPQASTVVSPGSNSSASLNLPLGTYTFCYYWQLDKDYNNDDYFDYHHRTTSAITLNVNSNDSVESAATVTLSPDSNVSNPNGKCGEMIAQNDGNLTPEEQANQGIHIYAITYHAPGEWLDGETAIVEVSIVFSDGTLIMGAVGDEQFTLTHVGLNTYTWLDDNGNIQTYTFTMEGFEIQSKVGIAGDYIDATSICIRQD